MKKFINHVKTYPKSYMILLTALVVGFIAVSGEGLSDYSQTSFWATFWVVAQIVCIVAIVIGWAYAWKAQDRK